MRREAEMSEQRRATGRAIAGEEALGAVPGVARRRLVALVESPHAGTGRQGEGALARQSPREYLEAAGVEVGEIVPVSALDHRLPQGARWRERGFVAVVAAGGDGTIGAVATQLAGTDLPLGILPMGTSNDVARSLGIPLDLAAACQVIAEGAPVEMDAGQALPAMTEPGALGAEPRDHSPSDTTQAERAVLAAQGAYFMHALTLGWNVAFARLATDVVRRQRWGSLAYAASAIEALTQFQSIPVKLQLTGFRALGPGGEWREETETQVLEYRVVQVAVINTPVFGGAMNLRLPRVEVNDRMLDFLVLEALEPAILRATVQGLLDSLARLAEARYRAGGAASSALSASSVVNGPEAPGISPAKDAEKDAEKDTETVTDEAAGFALPGVRRFQAREAVIETPGDVDVTLDGEIRAHTPVRVRVAPTPMRVLLPAVSRRG